MATKAEMIAVIAKRLESKVASEFGWPDLVASVQNGTPQDKARIVAGVQSGSAQAVGAAILELSRAKIKAEALAEATTMLADDSLDLTELDRML